jgi:tetratricopeptide (TPR) repeat protein
MTPLLFVSVLTAATPDAGLPTPTQAAMRGALEALFGLEPIIANPERLRDPLQADDITQRLDALAGLKHAFPADTKAQEPATAALSGLFSQYALETRRRFAFGDRETVPSRVRTLMSLCFTCHSRERAPADYQDMEKHLEAMTLSPFDKAQYLAATRQFDKAIEAYGAIVAQPAKDERSLLVQARAIKDLLTLLVRVKDDPKAADAFLEGLSKREDVAPFLKRPVAAWRKDVLAWKKENFDAQRASAKDLFAKGKALVQKANGPRSSLPDQTDDVAALRASAYLNLALHKSPTLPQRGEALFLLGLCAGALKSPLLWDVDLLFFEACIRENPKSALSRQCFTQLSDRLYFGYTGSSGTHLPDDELERLSTLRALAE